MGVTSRLRASARNALEIARFGRLGEAHGTPFDVVDRGRDYRLRRYAGPPSEDAPVVLLIPPLMLTADVYDIAPEVSAVSALAALGVAPWVVDFGAPEVERGGMDRSLDDHVRAVVQAIGRTRALTGRDVHLAGYSQGGMFAYQAAAFLRGAGIRSIITFGSPVDLHRNLPAVRSDLAGAFVKALFPLANAVLSRIEGLPGKVTSTAFKLLSTRKELEQRIEFLRSLHDRERIMKREARRRFLGGAGFVAWPGPAFRSFVEDFVVHNRMLSGGFVIDGHTVSLADLSCPILAFIGANDELARPPTVEAIVDAAPHADVRFVTVPSGHFGMVVGSRAMTTTWPLVATWISGTEGGKDATAALPEKAAEPVVEETGIVELDLALDVATRAFKDGWRRLGDVLASASDTAAVVRWQEPRLRRLAAIDPNTLVSASRELARRARETPEGTFFMWRGRAFSFLDADARITAVARGLYACGVRRGDRVGILMGSRPSLLSASTALGRLGAVAVIAPPNATREALRDVFDRLSVKRVVVDPERAVRATLLGRELLSLGGGGPGKHDRRTDAIDLEAVDPDQVVFPSDFELDPGRARDLSSYLLRPRSDDGLELRAVPVTNHRWALSAIGAAAACSLEPADTVCCAVPLHHPTGILVSAGSALASGARLALVELDGEPGAPLDPARLLVEIRRAGATVVFYTGEMLRPLLEEPVTRADRHLPVRLFAGSGMRKELAARLRERFGVDTIEFYAGTAHRAILADAIGSEPGSLGGILPGSAPVALVRRELDAYGHLVPAGTGEPGRLAVRVAPEELATLGEGVVADAFGDGAAWLVTNDVMERDAAGQHWFVDSLGSIVRTPGGDVSLRSVEDALYALPEIRLAAAWSSDGAIDAAFVSSAPITSDRLESALERLPEHARPRVLVRLSSIPLTEGFRPSKRALPERARASVNLRSPSPPRRTPTA